MLGEEHGETDSNQSAASRELHGNEFRDVWKGDVDDGRGAPRSGVGFLLCSERGVGRLAWRWREGKGKRGGVGCGGGEWWLGAKFIYVRGQRA